jgi:dUTP pyrophosphatase
VKVKVVKTEDRARLPKKAHAHDAGFDFYSIDTMTVPAGKTVKVRTGIAMQIPEGYELQIRPRSGLSAKSKLRIANSPGTVDSGYCGEILIIIDNISQNQADSYRINEGDRIAQGVLNKIEDIQFEEVDGLEDTERGSGGFGSSGN